MTTHNKAIIVLCIYLFISFLCNAQGGQFISGLLWVNIADSSAKAASDSTTFNSDLNALFHNYNVYSYKQSMPFAKNPAIRDIYEINCNCDENELEEQLVDAFGDFFSNVEKRPAINTLYDPADYYWVNNDPGMWGLHKIQDDKAWDITHGDPNLKLAVVDFGEPDISHPDLIGKIDPLYDIYDGSSFTSADLHPTAVLTTFVAATLDHGVTPNTGLMPGAAYNCVSMFSQFQLPGCLKASSLGAKIISISFYNSTCPTSRSNSDALIEDEILNNGTVVFRAAGNGPGDCSGGRLYPFSGLEDPRVIVVSGTDENDFLNHGWAVYSHYPEVDICAPSYDLVCGEPVSLGSYLHTQGTSLAAPIAAGVGALMLSVNPCLINVNVQDIIKQTADPIADASSYPGQVGAGRINAYKSVLGASFPNDVPAIASASNIGYTDATSCACTDIDVTGSLSNNFYSSTDDITSTATIDNGVVVGFRANTSIDLTNGFDAKPGSYFHAFINHPPCTDPILRLSNPSSQTKNALAIMNSTTLFSVYPNPNTGSFHLSMITKDQTFKDVFIYDVFGKQVYNNLKNTQSDLDIDISMNAKGVYLVKVVSGDKVSVSRVVYM